MALTIFIVICTIMFAINLISNVMLLATNKYSSFPLGNVIGIFISLSLFVYGIIMLIDK